VTVDGMDSHMWLGTDPGDAYGFMREMPPVQSMLDGKDPGAVGRAEDALRATMEAAAGPDGVALPARGWVVTARRR